MLLLSYYWHKSQIVVLSVIGQLFSRTYSKLNLNEQPVQIIVPAGYFLILPRMLYILTFSLFFSAHRLLTTGLFAGIPCSCRLARYFLFCSGLYFLFIGFPSIFLFSAYHFTYSGFVLPLILEGGFIFVILISSLPAFSAAGLA